jgi:glycosyltransferase involved in cell wall biosynthesis
MSLLSIERARWRVRRVRRALSRPPVAVVVPFLGSSAAAEEVLAAVAALELGEEDEVVVVDNGDGRAFAAVDPGGIRVLHDEAERSSYYARNRGAEETSAPWLLFMDSDCRPAQDLLDRYFSPPFDAGAGVVAGAVRAAVGPASLAARYAASRGHLDEKFHLEADPLPAGITANPWCEGRRSTGSGASTRA